IVVEAYRGVLEWKFGERSRLLVDPGRRVLDAVDTILHPVVTEARWEDEIEQVGYEGFRAEVNDWVQAVRGEPPAQLCGESVLPTVQLIEECYQRRVPTDEPWFTEALPPVSAAKRKSADTSPRVLVTGASGFIGCRLV